MAAPAGRFSVAFDAAALDWDVAWTRLDSTDSLVASWTVDRGRMYELDRTDAARATVEITDVDGVLDPTNPAGPYYGRLQPLLQAAICRRDPAAGEWQPRFRGWITDFDYVYDPSPQRFGRLTLQLTDIFELLGAVEMQPGQFGDDPTAATPPVPDSAGQVWFEAETVQDRINSVLYSALRVDLDAARASFAMVFSGNVSVERAVYSPGSSPLDAIAEAADAELLTAANVFTDRTGRIVFHGRVAKWDPAAVIAGIAPPYDWDYHHWQAGDGAAVAAVPGTVAQIREFAFNRGVSKIINSASATPQGIADTDVAGQLVQDATSVGRYGIRSWSAQNLITQSGLADSSTALVETRRMGQYMVANYKTPVDRIATIRFRSTPPGRDGYAYTWQLMSRADIGDMVDVTVAGPGGGGFDTAQYMIEGIHETSKPAGPGLDDDTVELDLSPRVVDHSMFP